MIVFFVGGCARPSPAVTAVPTCTFPATEETSTPTVLPAPSPTAEIVLYTVQPGDTLLGIAQVYGVSVEALVEANGLPNPDVLSAGQTLVIPVEGVPAPITLTAPAVTSEPSPTLAPLPVLPTLTPSGPPLVEIGQVLGSGDLENEVVVVRNRGGAASLEKWTISDAEGNTFTFPSFVLFGGAQVHVHSTGGNSTPWDLYWGRVNPAWNGGELISLRDAAGEVVDTYIVP